MKVNLSFCVLLILPTGGAFSQDKTDRTENPESCSQVTTIVYDEFIGDYNSSAATVDEGRSVRLEIRNINPFRAQYQINSEVYRVRAQQPAGLEFVAGQPPGGQGNASNELAEMGTMSMTGGDIADFIGLWNFLNLHDDLIALIHPEKINGESVHREAKKLVQRLVKGGGDPTVQDFRDLAQKQDEVWKKLSPMLNDDNFKKWLDKYPLIKEKLTYPGLPKIVEYAEKAGNLYLSIAKETFYRSRVIQANSESDLIRFSVMRTLPGSSPELVMRHEVDVIHGWRLDFSAGLGVSRLADYAYSVKDTSIEVPIDETTNETVARKLFYVADEPDISYMPTALAHFSYTCSSNFRAGVVLGTGLPISDGRVKPLFLAGGSLFIGNRNKVAVSGGIAIGTVRRLASGYNTGIPIEYTGTTAPTRDITCVNWFIGLSYSLGGRTVVE